MRTRWVGWITLVVGLALVLVAAAGLAEAAKVSLKLGHIRADTSPTHKGALKQGVVAAQENGVIPIKNMSFYEVQKYLTLTHYVRDVETFYISPAKWQVLSPAQQKALLDASDEAGNLATELTKQELDEATKFLATKMTVIEPDLASIQKALEGLYEEQFEGKLWPKGLLQQVRDFK